MRLHCKKSPVCEVIAVDLVIRTTQRTNQPRHPGMNRANSTPDPSPETTGCLFVQRKYCGIEDGHKRLDSILDEDHSHLRITRALNVFGMFRRLAGSFTYAWLDAPIRCNQKLTGLPPSPQRRPRQKRFRPCDFLETNGFERGIEGPYMLVPPFY